MNTEWYIARRLFTEKGDSRKISGRIIRVALAGIVLGMTLMLLAVAVVTGFKKEISDKVSGFGAHIQLMNFDTNLSFETRPVRKEQPFLPALAAMDNVERISPFATKPGIIKTGEYIQGIVLKGVDSTYNRQFFSRHLQEGELPLFGSERSSGVLISRNLCNKLMLKLDDPLFLYFINEDERIPRIRRFSVSGIFATHLQEFDDLFVIGDIRQVQQVNGWDSLQVSGYEIYLRNPAALEETFGRVRREVAHYSPASGTTLRPMTIRQKYPQIFDWLSILDLNVWIILTLMITVAGFNMISALLVLILERGRMIGTLKALGSRNRSIRKIFLYLSSMLIARGLLLGNLLGIVLLLLQKHFRLFSLDPSSYYMEIVPVHLSLPHFLLLNAGTMAITVLMLVAPAGFISRISPEKSLRFD